MTSDPVVLLRVANQRAYVWDVDDAAILRSKHHICGILTGTLPHLSQQNVFLGVPLVLMPEEVVLLVEQGFAALVDDPEAHEAPSEDQLQQWDHQRKEFIKLHLAQTESKLSQEASSRSLSEEALRKRKEREERKALKAQIPSTDIQTPDFQAFADPSPASKTSTPIASASEVNPLTTLYPVILPAASDSFEWYNANRIYSTISSAKSAGIWSYPSTLFERARCGVFKGLWDQGYFMGGGIKFGGEYLVYPGDPLRYHSHFTATVIDSPTSALRPMEIVAHGRLGTATKKAHLLCGWDDEKQDVSYLSIEWSGFG
ncbi:hypothetical protein HGRIS_013218 [Hohenbuehelia grisea]|uniref:tRNA-splicing endonuclease subunit Sen34 n=1 Tax=Hohenbuehelia grisea TaxID=104357 RepID=A0ABR3IUU1_9AGAR